MVTTDPLCGFLLAALIGIRRMKPKPIAITKTIEFGSGLLFVGGKFIGETADGASAVINPTRGLNG